jgi:hypothetical protein
MRRLAEPDQPRITFFDIADQHIDAVRNTLDLRRCTADHFGRIAGQPDVDLAWDQHAGLLRQQCTTHGRSIGTRR